jgi:hypothetical protein
VPLVVDQDVVSALLAHGRPQRSTKQFVLGVRGGVFTTCTPSSARTASSDAAYVVLESGAEIPDGLL